MTTEEVAGLVARFLREASPRPIKGSTLSVLLRAQIPDFDPNQYGCRTLRDFVRKFASDEAVEVGQAGMDIVYALRNTEHPSLFATPPQHPEQAHDRGPLGQLISNRRVWKTFVTPDSPFRLFFDSGTGVIRVVPPNSDPEPNWREIERISADALLQYAKEFVANQGETAKAQLSATLSEPHWWIPYFETLQTLGLKTRWVFYRRQRIIDEFSKRTTAAAAPRNLSADVGEGQFPPVAHSSAGQAPAAPASASIVKRTAVDVVQRMTDAELRALNLPLGYVIDSLTTR